MTRIGLGLVVRRACAFLAFAASTLAGQDAPRTVALRGVAFDSLNNRPLVGAVIRVLGMADSARSDASGKFQLEGVAAGTRLLTMEHPDIEVIGLFEISATVDVKEPRSDVVIAIPSFKTLWRGVCGGQPSPVDSGFLYGAIRDARTQDGVAGVRVSVSWSEIGLGANKKIKNTRFTLETRSDAVGAYVACGVPVDVPLVINVGVGADTPMELELPAAPTRVQKRDISMGLWKVVSADTTGMTKALTDSAAIGAPIKVPSGSVGAESRGSELGGDVEGVIASADGSALPQVMVTVAGGFETRSDSSGRFLLKNVPIGTRAVQFAAIGVLPATRIVDVMAGVATDASVKMERVNTLANVKVTATRASETLRAFEERKRSGFGYIQDSTQVARTASMPAMIRGFPSVIVGTKRGGDISFRGTSITSRTCPANIRINNMRADISDFWALNVDEIAWVEVYPRGPTVPPEFKDRLGCGVVAVFTKSFMKN